MTTVSSRDVQDIVSKLSSDKAKTREEGIKLLNTWLEGERSVGFCRYIGQKSAVLKPNEIPHSETWAFLITLLVQCASLEISSSKRRLPKLLFAKTLRIVVQRAEDVKFSGKKLLLLSVMRVLFNHVSDVLKDVPSFQSEYGIILRHLLSVRDYRFHTRKRVYCNLVLLHIEKVITSLSGNIIQSNSKEDAFRCILTLHSLLENPPGDFPNNLREDVVKGFVKMFSIVRDEGKISRKLLECVNTYLLRDGPNLGCQSLEIHDAVKQFAFRCWITTHDRGLKDSLIFYARLQLNLTRGAADGSALVEQLLDVVGKDLDQSSICSTNLTWGETSKDDKSGNLKSSHWSLVELAALVFYRACVNTPKVPSAEKRARKEHAAAHIREGIMKGKWLWTAAFCCLAHNYGTRMSKDLLVYWFEGICSTFERVINEANTSHAYDGLLWVLRSLQQLSSMLLSVSRGESLTGSSVMLNEPERGWQTIWSCLMHGLPVFSNIPSVAEAAVLLLGEIILNDSLNAFIVPRDVWDLRLFKRVPSASVLCFISCYFSRRGSQGDLRDSLHLRQNLLRAVLAPLNWQMQKRSLLNQRMVVLLPAAAFALCSGCASLRLDLKGLFPYCSSMDVPVAAEEWVKREGHEQEDLHGLFECSVEILAKIDHGSCPKVCQSKCYQNVRLACHLRDALLNEMETCILESLVDKEVEKMLLSDVFYTCALISNFMYGSYTTRVRDEGMPFLYKMGDHLLKLLDFAVSGIEKCCNDIRSNCLSSNCIFEDMGSMVASLNGFVCSPLFNSRGEQNIIDFTLSTAVSESLKRLLKALSQLYEECSQIATNFQSDGDQPDFGLLDSVSKSPLKSSASMIMDVELDLGEESKDVDVRSTRQKTVSCIPALTTIWKFDIISLISSFFAVLPLVAWEILFELMDHESDANVWQYILLNLCQHPHWPSSRKFSSLVTSMNNMVDLRSSLKLPYYTILAAIHDLLQNLVSLDTAGKVMNICDKDKNVALCSREKISEQSLMFLGDLLNGVAENDLFDWYGRSKLVDCICNFILLRPQIGQTMIEKLLIMLRDPDYRVRCTVARRVGILFQTWDGHDELFQDICSNFGAKLVLFSKEKVVTESEVLAAGPQPQPTMETIIITLMHIAFFSEKIELEALFMMCVISAIDPCQRELVVAALDNLSRQLQYATRSKYLEELMGSILFCWVACGVSLVSLVEIRDLFVSKMEPGNFIQYCCHWLLPALMLHGDTSGLKWVAKIACLHMASLVKNHFVPIFSICMALHCSKKPGSDNGAAVLQSSILCTAEISENERDKLIKKHMVSIVSHIFSLTSCASDPLLPFFSRDTIVHAIQTIVDGFLDMEDSARSSSVIDKINVFRPDRVFMFIIEMHYKVTAAVHHRHKCHRLAGIEVLINILGKRAVVSSTFSYLLNLVGQFFSCHALQEQCCHIISTLLQTFRSNPSQETAGVLGEQLQFLVSKLVACCTPLESNIGLSGTQSSLVLSLLNQLTVESDPSLYDYIKELEPFPELEILDRVREFHRQLCLDYSPKQHLLKFVKRSCHLPPRLLLSSLEALHKKLVMGEIFQLEGTMEDTYEDNYCFCDNQIVQAIWTLVPMCGLDDGNRFTALVSDFISRVGIGDPHSVVFRLPGEFGLAHVCSPLNAETSRGMAVHMDKVLSEELLISLMRLLMKYLVDDCVKIIDMTSQAIKGILSTDGGQRALLSFDSYERSLIEVHCKGVNMELVQSFLLEQEKKFDAEAFSLEQPTIWKTQGKDYESWICPLVYALIGYCNDIILRLCQDIVLLKAEVAELLLPNVVVNLAGRKNMDLDLCKIISFQVRENILTESNKLMKSIQVILDTLNNLRLCYVMERTAPPSVSIRREEEMYAKSSSYGSKSRSSTARTKDSTVTSAAWDLSTSLWDKSCGAYFTAVLYVEYWCEEHFKCLTLGSPDFSQVDVRPPHIEILVSAVTQINEPDSLYGIIQLHELTSQIVTFEHEGNWSKALEYYDLQVRSEAEIQTDESSRKMSLESSQTVDHISFSNLEGEMKHRKSYKGLIRSLQQMGCTHVLDLYCHGLTSRKGQLEQDLEFTELQYEAAWRAGNWDFSLLYMGANSPCLRQNTRNDHFHENLHSCLRALQEGDSIEFFSRMKDSKQELVLSIYQASRESTEYIYSAIIKLQIFYHLGMAWDLRWKTSFNESMKSFTEMQKLVHRPVIPTFDQLSWLNREYDGYLKRGQLHMNLLEPFVAFRRVLLQILGCMDCTMHHLLDSASILRKGSRFSQAAAVLHECKLLYAGAGERNTTLYWFGRLEEAKLLRAQGQQEMAVNLAKYISQNNHSSEFGSNVYRLVGKWLAETRSSDSRTILERYLKHAVLLSEDHKCTDRKSIARQSQAHFHLAHYADALYRSCEERLNSNEWQAAMRLRKLKTKELEALVRRLKSSSKGEKTDYSVKIQELQKQISMDKEEDEKLQGDRDNFLGVALMGYKRCLVIGDKYDVRVVFRLVSLWFSISSRQIVINSMLDAIKEVQSYKFIPLVYQIASRMGSRDGQGPHSFQFALVSLVKKMAIDHPYHTVFQLLALANGDRIKDKQRSRNSFVVDMDKKLAAENLLEELSSSRHGAIIGQMRQMVEIYIKLAELETRREDTNKKITLPREIRSIRELELVPVVTSTFPVDRSCQYCEGSFPHFKGLAESVMVMNGINAPKVVECLGSDGKRYRQLAKSGNDDLRQDAVMEQFFGLVNTFLQNHRDTWKRRLGIRTYKVVPFTPSAGVLEWVNGTLPLGEYLTGSTRKGGAHGRYGMGDWTFSKCREHMTKEQNKLKAFQEVCLNCRPVMHYFFLERFLQPADWFEKRLAYTRSVAASSMVGYIVGLGDRHSMNILIDQATAEVVHIDLGVAFEQGLMLKTPERVPFRLTRDIIDGMGVTGVEGVFRRCCEETLSVMRTNKEALLTIVEVFIHDPLYKWALSPLKALQRQKETDDDLETSLEDSEEEYEGNKDAARALLRVKQKLDGYEEGQMRSVHGQVQQLIQDAIDPDRLCQMFPGWGAWL